MTSPTRCPVVAEFDPLGPDYLGDPFAILAGGHRPQPSMVSLDGAEHSGLRRPATHAFTAKRVQGMAPGIRARVESLLDAVGDASRFDLVEALCFPVAGGHQPRSCPYTPTSPSGGRSTCGCRRRPDWPSTRVDRLTSVNIG